jgi:hypothetical protein
MRARVFVKEYAKKGGERSYPAGTRLTLRSLSEWARWFPGYEKFTRAVDEVIDSAAQTEARR